MLGDRLLKTERDFSLVVQQAKKKVVSLFLSLFYAIIGPFCMQVIVLYE